MDSPHGLSFVREFLGRAIVCLLPCLLRRLLQFPIFVRVCLLSVLLPCLKNPLKHEVVPDYPPNLTKPVKA